MQELKNMKAEINSLDEINSRLDTTEKAIYLVINQ